MLTANDEQSAEAAQLVSGAPSSETSATSDVGEKARASGKKQSRVARMLRVEWLGQTVASLCWIASMLFYGVSSIGDQLQLCAATAWLVANIASVATKKTD
jgi:hypothetical protein